MKFTRAGAYEDLPITIACGQCRACLLEKSRQWATRCVNEASMHKDTAYITLTYSPENLPEGGNLQVRDWQLFAKRLRKQRGPFRFMHCGEYGEEKGRPHYHALIFGINWDEDKLYKKKNDNGDVIYTSKSLEETWGNGYCTVGDLTYETAAYVARYTLKKQTGFKASPKWDDRKAEYITMSRRPGIGAKWIEKWMTDVYPWDEVVIDRKATRPPKYYDQQLEKINPELMKKIKGARKRKARKHEKDNTPERRIVRENVLKAKLARNKREIED